VPRRFYLTGCFALQASLQPLALQVDELHREF
jgi:hypothetical protein